MLQDDAVNIYLEISNKDGEILVHIARESIERYILENIIINPPIGLNNIFYEKKGVFVTLNSTTQSGKVLRGCIGYPLPEKPLIESLIDSAISAATKDHRFEKVRIDELNKIIVEVSVLTTPKKISVSSSDEYVNHITIGTDGLIIRWKYGSGLLLPQVPIEQGWGIEEFLSNACLKAGATSDYWHYPDIDIYKFNCVIFDEISPRGKIIRRKIL